MLGGPLLKTEPCSCLTPKAERRAGGLMAPWSLGFYMLS